MIRPATLADVDAIHRIYAPYVRDTIISFELEVPTLDELRARFVKITQTYPWLVAEENGVVLGYAYASPFHERAAYSTSANVAVYLDGAAHRRGLGRALYEALFIALKPLNLHMLYAGISIPNEKSIGLHEAMGFTLVGIYREAGFKFGAFHDVGWWQRAS